jgi:hypothetical protein
MTPPTATATAGAQVLTSADGALTIHVPAGAAPPGTELTATPLGPADQPPELIGVELRGSYYRLEPDGLTFAEPVLITRRVAAADTGYDLATDGMPIIALALRTSDGRWEWLADQAILTDGEHIYVTGLASHTSTLVDVYTDNFAQSGWTPETLELYVGGKFTLNGTLTAPVDAPAPPEIREPSDLERVLDRYRFLGSEPFSHTGVLVTQADVFNSTGWEDLPPEQRGDVMPGFFQKFECAQPGSGWATVGYEVVSLTAGETFTQSLEPPRATIIWQTEVTCNEGSGTVTFVPDCYDDATLPCSALSFGYDADLESLVIKLESPPGTAPVSMSTRFAVNDPAYQEAFLECRFFGSTTNCVATDENGAVVGEPGPTGTANVDGPWSMAFPVPELADFLEERGGQLESVTPVDVFYSDADGNVGGGTLDDAAQAEFADWITELIPDLR